MKMYSWRAARRACGRSAACAPTARARAARVPPGWRPRSSVAHPEVSLRDQKGERRAGPLRTVGAATAAGVPAAGSDALRLAKHPGAGGASPPAPQSWLRGREHPSRWSGPLPRPPAPPRQRAPSTPHPTPFDTRACRRRSSSRRRSSHCRWRRPGRRSSSSPGPRSTCKVGGRRAGGGGAREPDEPKAPGGWRHMPTFQFPRLEPRPTQAKSGHPASPRSSRPRSSAPARSSKSGAPG